MMHHAYESGFHTLGRQAMMEPIEWTKDGWFKAKGVDAGKPITKPKGRETVPHGMALSDDFSTNKFGIQWSFFRGDVSENQRVNYKDGALELTAKGTSPSDTSPLTFLMGEQAYQFEVDKNGCIRLSPQRGLRIYEPAPGDLCGRKRQG